ncbi:MAG: penicillin acylase family protein [Candidatus Lokiarchaeota archaeon]|nr:penicillin acylase family protein [Candidatus Lokiarchaeota archaeon]
MSKKRLPQVDGEVTLPGLKSPVKIIRDKAGAPHIYAKNEEDLVFAQGYCHAQERFWQMELNRRVSRGQMSEIFGELALGTDIASRTFGFARVAKKDWELLDEHMKSLIQAYVAGVNVLITNKNWKIPVEHSLLKHKKPRPWEIEDTMALARYMCWTMSGCWHLEIARMAIADKVGIEHANEIAPIYPDENPTVMGEKVEMNVFEDGILKAIQGPFIKKGGASNSWTITPSNNDTKSAVHCNDMHLELSVPAIWYYNHLIVEKDGKRDLNVSGVCLPGLPLVLVGHNQYFAYGSTLARADAEDLFIEKMNPDDLDQYEFKGEWKNAEIVEEEINIKHKTSHKEKVLITHHGPIISKGINEEKRAIAYCGMSLRPSKVLKSYYLINTGQEWDDFVEAMRMFTAPQMNMSYADIYGNIGWYVSGKIPIRAKGTGTIPVPGWTGEYEWIDEIPFEEMPHAFNPKSGMIVTCNNKLVPDSYPYYLSGVSMNGYRAKRITNFIQSKGKMHFPKDHMDLQNDVKCLMALDLIHVISSYQSKNPDIKYFIANLENWDGQLTVDSTPGLYYEVFKYNLNKIIFLPILGEELTVKYLGVGYIPVLSNISDMYGNDGPILHKLLKNPDSWWIQQGGGKTEVLKQAFNESIQWLKSTYGDKWKSVGWGDAHRVSIAHAMAIQKPMDEVFNVGGKEGKPIGGDTDTPNQTAWNPSNPYNLQFFAASYRQIVDLGNLENSFYIYPTGQSGHLASPHYCDMFEMWRTGKYFIMNWSDKQILQEKESELILTPLK